MWVWTGYKIRSAFNSYSKTEYNSIMLDLPGPIVFCLICLGLLILLGATSK
jgi:hypothetical protein